MPKLLKSLALLLALPLVLAGCKIDSINYFPPKPAHIRIVNVLGTTAPINVAANGVVAWSGLPFEAMTGYQDFNNSTTEFTVSSPALHWCRRPTSRRQQELHAGRLWNALCACDSASWPDTNQAPPSGKFLLSFFDAAPVGNGAALGIYPIDIYLTPPGQVMDNASPTFTFVQFGTGNLFGQFSAGQYQLRTTIAGTKTIIYDSGMLTFQEKTATDVIIYSRGSEVLPNVLLDDVNGAGQQVVANNLLARVKAVNAAFQSGPVNQFFNGVAEINNLLFPGAAVYLIVPSGTGTVTFEASAAPGATIASLTGTLCAGHRQFGIRRRLRRCDQRCRPHRQQPAAGDRLRGGPLCQCLARFGSVRRVYGRDEASFRDSQLHRCSILCPTGLSHLYIHLQGLGYRGDDFDAG